MTTTHALANSPKTFLDRDNWMRTILAADLPDNAKAVALTIALHLRVKTGTCNPSYATLAAESHVGERSTYRLVALLESAGWLSVQRTQGRLSNQYVLLNPANHVAGLNPAKTRHPNPAKSTRQPCQQVAGKKRNRKIPSVERFALPLMAGERDALSRDDSSSIGGSASDAAPDLVLEPVESPQIKTETEPKAPKRTPEGEYADGAENHLPTVIARRESQGHWRELRTLWDRGWAADESPKQLAIARQAFERACHEVEPGEIIEAARTWIAAADAPRFLPQLAHWLTAKGWEQLPPAKRKRANRSHGNGSRRDHLPRRNGNKVDLTRLALKMGGYVEDDDGKLYHPDGDDGCSIDWRASL